MRDIEKIVGSTTIMFIIRVRALLSRDLKAK